MVKRPASPPPSKDEPKFLTIVHPFPLHANLELMEDRINLARWLACVVGDATQLGKLYSVYYKPSGANHCILEVARDYDSFDRLLGKHRWSEFLKTPEPEEVGKESRIYWCFHVSVREVTKLGWKRVDFDDRWFEHFNPRNKKTVYPYPKSVWCELPNEDPTGLQLCRPIPLRTFDRAIDGTVPEFAPQKPGKNRLAIQPRSVPGAAAWVEEKAKGRAIKPAPPVNKSSAALGAWAKPIIAATTSPTAWAAAAAAAMERPAPPELWSENGIWASAATSSSSRRGMIDIPPADEMTPEQEEDVWRRVNFDWAEDVEEEERALAAAMNSTSIGDREARSSVPTAPASPIASSSFSTNWDVTPSNEPTWTCPPPPDCDDDDEDPEGFGLVGYITPTVPVLTTEDHRRAHGGSNYQKGGFNGGRGKDWLEGWQCPNHITKCTAGVCPDAAAERKRRQQGGGGGGKGGRGRGRGDGMGQFVHPQFGRGVVRPVRGGGMSSRY